MDADRVQRRLKLHDLRVLMAVAQAGSINKAAKQLAISQPALSRTIADLEQTFGVPLLDRGPRGVVPTPYGGALIKRGTAVFDELRLGITDLQSLADPAAGEVRIAAPVVLGGGFVATVVDRLARKYPRVVCHLWNWADDTPAALSKLQQRELDLIITIIIQPMPAEIMETEILYSERTFVLAGTNNPWARRRKVRLADLVNEPWALPAPTTPIAGLILDIFRSEGLEVPRATVVCASAIARMALVAKNHFLTATAESAFRFAGSEFGIKPLPIDLPQRRSIALVTLKNRMLTPAAQLFIKTAREVASSV